MLIPRARTATLVVLALAAASFSRSASAQTQRLPSFEDGPAERIEGACGRIVVRLPGVVDVRDCDRLARRPRGTRIDETFVVQLSPSRLGAQHFLVSVSEASQTDADRQAAAARFAAEVGDLPAASARMHVRRAPALGPAAFEVRSVDGTTFRVTAGWSQVRRFDVPNRPSDALRAYAERTSARIAELAARTLVRTRGGEARTRDAVLSFFEGSRVFTLPDGLEVREVSLVETPMEEPPRPTESCVVYVIAPIEADAAAVPSCHAPRACLRACRGEAPSVLREPGIDPRVAALLDAPPARRESDPSTAPERASAPEPGGPCPVVVADPNPPLRVRARPSSRSDVIGELADGTEVTILERRGSWARIVSPAPGWVYAPNLRERCP